jgi:hypothetical protein
MPLKYIFHSFNIIKAVIPQFNFSTLPKRDSCLTQINYVSCLMLCYIPARCVDEWIHLDFFSNITGFSTISAVLTTTQEF